MTPDQFAYLKVGDEILVRCVVTAVGLATGFARPAYSPQGEDEFGMCMEEAVGYASVAGYEFIVGDRVRWDGRDGWFIVHLIPDTGEAIILNDAASIGPRRTALSRLNRTKP